MSTEISNQKSKIENPYSAIGAVIFDMGGVIVRTQDRSPRQRLAARLNLSYDQLSALVFDSETAKRATLGQISTRAHWEAVRAALGLSPEEFPVVPDDFWGGDFLDTELVDYVRGLRRQVKTGLLSNAWDDLRPVLENRWKILDAFDEVIISAEVGLAKPDPRIFQLALERLDASPAEAVFIDDFAANVEAARALGLHVVHFQDPEQARAEIERLLNTGRRTDDE
jgi:epoxide hydrolase-like predicted phosphatase